MRQGWGPPPWTDNIATVLSPSSAPNPGQILNISPEGDESEGMKQMLLSLALICAAGMAQAACYADYKAKRDNPLRLQYGVAQINGPCTPQNAAAELGPKLLADGWQLLEIVSVFDDSGLEARRADAGEFYLRY